MKQTPRNKLGFFGMIYRRMLQLFLVSSCLSGCGVMVPDVKEVWDQDVPGTKLSSGPNDPTIPGIVDPHAKKPRAPASGAAQIEYEVKKKVYCELRRAVKAADYYGYIDRPGKKMEPGETRGLPTNWGAQVTLSLEVDESSALNPGLSLNTPLQNGIINFSHEFIGTGASVPNTLAGTMIAPLVSTPQSYAFGLGGALSSTATRIDKFNPYYTIADLLNPNYQPHLLCTEPQDAFEQAGISPAKSSPFIRDDLGITEWLLGSSLVNDLIPSSPPAPPSGATAQVDKLCKRFKGPNEAVNARYVGCLRRELNKLGYDGPAADQIMASMASSSSAAAGGGGGGGSSPKPDIISLEEKFQIVTSGNATPSWKLVRVSANQGAPFFGAGRTRTHDLVITIGPAIQATSDAHNNLVGPSATGTANKASLSPN